MKSFIVSLAIIVMGVCGLVYSTDMCIYTNAQTHLKALTESAAACAAVSFDDQSYESDGDIIYNQVKTETAVRYFIYRASLFMPCFQNGKINLVSCIADSENDSVTVTIEYVSNSNFFRSIFLNTKTLTHTSSFEWVSYEL